jgi:hypothetical protein
VEQLGVGGLVAEALLFLMRGNRGSRQWGVVDPDGQGVREDKQPTWDQDGLSGDKFDGQTQRIRASPLVGASHV